jgi:hypothetical protein
MADNPFTGSWTYRSLLKQPRGSIPFDQLQFGVGCFNTINLHAH